VFIYWQSLRAPDINHIRHCLHQWWKSDRTPFCSPTVCSCTILGPTAVKIRVIMARPSKKRDIISPRDIAVIMDFTTTINKAVVVK